MAIATYKDLCLDALDPVRLGRFWAAALGLRAAPPREDGVVRLEGATPEHTVWVNPVSESRTPRQRVHLDLDATSVAEIQALGATVLDDTQRWTVLADPEGGELCVFVRERVERPLYEVVVKTGPTSYDARRIAGWWAEVLGTEAVHDERGFSWVEPVPGAPFECLVFSPVPEPKTVKNSIHLDLWAEPEQLVATGATLLHAPTARTPWSVLADPDGNELCAFDPPG